MTLYCLSWVCVVSHFFSIGSVYSNNLHQFLKCEMSPPVIVYYHSTIIYMHAHLFLIVSKMKSWASLKHDRSTTPSSGQMLTELSKE